jgi:hypothetical protein
MLGGGLLRARYPGAAAASPSATSPKPRNHATAAVRVFAPLLPSAAVADVSAETTIERPREEVARCATDWRNDRERGVSGDLERLKKRLEQGPPPADSA